MIRIARKAEEVLAFWFPKGQRAERSKIWYSGGAEVDNKIRANFGPLFDQVDEKPGSLDDWLTSPRGTLAYIVLFDQFSRNAFRGKARAFSYDHLSLAESLKRKDDFEEVAKVLDEDEIAFFYMPLMHAEDVQVLKTCVEVFGKIHEMIGTTSSENGLSYAKKHLDIIKKYGRYPHRNKALGREDTAEEVEYLKTAERFGQ